MTEGSGSMFDTVKQHGEDIELLKQADIKHDERLKLLEDRSIKLENTVMSENRDTRQTFVQYSDKISNQNEDLLEIVKSAMGMKATSDVQQHELRMAKWNTMSTVFLKVSGGLVAALGSGGIIYYVVQNIVGK